MNFLRYLIFFLMLFCGAAFAQWEAGASFNYKTELPETGIGINITRNLPFQFASFGIKWRIGADFFRSKEDGETFSNEEYHTELIITFFGRTFSPYIGLSFGAGHYSVNEFNEYIFFPGLLAGVKLPLNNWLHPFLEIYSNYYFSDFNNSETLKDISSFQLSLKAGFQIKL